MAKIQVIQDLNKVKDPNEFMRHASQVHQQTTDAVNGGLEFDQNIRSQTVVVTFNAANTDVAVNHNLNKTDVNYLKGKQSAALSVFDGVTKATNKTIYLRADQPGTVTLILT